METVKQSESIFLVPFFNFFYYLFFVPFKIKLDCGKNQYYLNSSRFRTTACMFVHIGVVSVVVTFTALYLLRFWDKDPPIIICFEFVMNLAKIISICITIQILWKGQDQLLEVIEYGRVKDIRMKKSILVIIYGWLISVIVFLGFAHLATESEKPQLFFFRRNFEKNVSENYFMFWNELNTNQQLMYLGFHGIFMYLSTFYLTNQGIFVVIALVMRYLSKEFVAQMEESWREADLEKGIHYYRDLKQKTDLIRDTFGNHLLAFYITSVCYYVEAPHVILGGRGNMEKCVLAYFAITGGIWLLGAEFHHVVRNAMLNLNKRFTKSPCLSFEDRLKLLAISNEMAVDPIALSNKYFPVTYGHLGTMVGLIVTYGIIVFQLYHQDTQGSKMIPSQ